MSSDVTPWPVTDADQPTREERRLAAAIMDSERMLGGKEDYLRDGIAKVARLFGDDPPAHAKAAIAFHTEERDKLRLRLDRQLLKAKGRDFWPGDMLRSIVKARIRRDGRAEWCAKIRRPGGPMVMEPMIFLFDSRLNDHCRRLTIWALQVEDRDAARRPKRGLAPATGAEAQSHP